MLKLEIDSWLSDHEVPEDEDWDSMEIIDSASIIDAQEGFDILKKDIEKVSMSLGKLLPTGRVSIDEQSAKELSDVAQTLSYALMDYGYFLNRLSRVTVPLDQCPICCSDEHAGKSPH